MVLVLNKSNLTTLKGIDGKNDFVPAIIAAYMSKEGYNETVSQSVSIALDVLGIYTGATAWRTADKIGRLFLRADLISSGASLTATTLADCENCNGIRKSLNIISGITSVLAISGATRNNLKNKANTNSPYTRTEVSTELNAIESHRAYEELPVLSNFETAKKQLEDIADGIIESSDADILLHCSNHPNLTNDLLAWLARGFNDAKGLKAEATATKVAQAVDKLNTVLKNQNAFFDSFTTITEGGEIIQAGISMERAIQLSNLIGSQSLLSNTTKNAINALGSSRSQFFDDLLAGVSDLKHICNNVGDLTPGMVRAWKGLFNTGLRTDVVWLTRASKWLDEGAEIVESGANTIVRKNGEELGKIIDGELQPTKFLVGGTKIDDAGSGYDFYKLSNGDIGFKARFDITIEDEFGIVFVRLENRVEDIGKGSLNNNLLELEIDVKPDGIRLAKGENVFNKIFDNQVGLVQGIKAEWGIFLADNLNTFNNLILTQVNPGNMTLRQAAFETFTGRMATSKGFTSIGPNDIIGTPNADGTYDFVTVIFR